MYPTAYTLTVLVLTLLQYSFDKRYANNGCQNGVTQDGNSTIVCQHNVSRKEIRQLNRREFESFVQVFNEYSTRNDTDELNANINELGVVQIFDELLQSKRMLTPFWEYRLELNAENPETSPLWSAQQFQAVNQASDAQWLVEFIENENSVDDDEFFGDDPFSKLWKRRRAALRLVRKLKKTDVFWHLLLLVSIESGMDQTELHINRTSCVRDFGKFTRWANEGCRVALSDGEFCKSSGDCFSRRCSKNYCASTKRLVTPIASNIHLTSSPTTSNENSPLSAETTQQPTIPTSTEKSQSFESTNEIFFTETTAKTTAISTSTENAENVEITAFVSSGQDESVTLSPTEIEEASNGAITNAPTTQKPAHNFDANEMSNEVPNFPTLLKPTTAPSKKPVFQPKYVFRMDPPFNRQESEPIEVLKEQLRPDSKLAVTTEFLANELSTPYPSFNFGLQPSDEKPVKKERRKGKKRRKNGRKKTTTTSGPHDQIPATEMYSDPTLSTFENSTLSEDNSPIDQENYGVDTLDALLVYLPTPKVPTMISWTSKMPLRMAYFGFTIIEGNLGKHRQLKEKGHKRAKGARIYVRGLGMPSGYTQVTQGRQMKTGIGALGRVLNPNNNEPFVEFKMRVENRYGTPCKQMCLDSHQRYRRCARRTVRLSPYKKFSDPIPYFDTENLATSGQFTGKGYYKKRKLTYLLFKCD